MQSVFKGMAVTALALVVTSYAHAGGKSPAPAYDVTFENKTFDYGAIRLTYPKIEIKGANIPKAEIEKMTAVETTLGEWLPMAKNFLAASVEIPSVTLVIDTETLKGEVSCTGLKLQKIAGGKVGQSGLKGCSGQLTDKSKEPLKLALGTTNLNDFNFAHAYRLWADKAGPDDKEAVALYASGSFEGFSLSLTGPDADIQYGYDRNTESAGPKIKLPTRSIKEIIQQISASNAERPKTTEGGDSSEPSQDNIKKQAALTVLDLFESYEPSTGVIENYSFSFIDRKSSYSPNTIGAKLSVQVARMDARGLPKQATGISFTNTTGSGKIGSASWNGYSATPFFAEMRRFIEPPKPAVDIEGQPRRIGTSLLELFAQKIQRLSLAPYANLGTIVVNDLNMTLIGLKKSTPDGGHEGTSKVAFKTLTIRFDKPVDGLPTSARVAVERLEIPAAIAMGFNPRQVTGLRQLGLDPLNVSFALDGSLDTETRTLTVNEYGFAVTDLFSFKLKGTLGNASFDLFVIDPEKNAKAISGITLKDASLHVEDTGGIAKYVGVVAANRGVTPDEFKAIFPVMVAAIPQPYVSMNSVKTVRDAVLAFWQKPGTLDISVKSKNDAGVRPADLEVSNNPQSIDALFEVKATAK